MDAPKNFQALSLGFVVLFRFDLYNFYFNQCRLIEPLPPDKIMKPNLPPILLTSCVIVSDLTVALKDQDTRVRLTLESMEKWLSIAPDLRFVICDGSGFDFSAVVHEKFPTTPIECLFFENNKALVAVHGKGFGEGEIVN